MNHTFTLSLTHCSIERSLEQYMSLASLFNLNYISFYKIHSPQGIIYQTPLAIQIARGNLEKAQVINQQIISNLKDNYPNAQLALKVITTVHSSGLLEFFFKAHEINKWLQRLPEIFLKSYTLSQFDPELREISDRFFPLQYAHARCCSLLRSGDLDRLIQLQTLNFDQSAWFWLSPNPIPLNEINWLQSEERELIAQIITIIDGIDSLKSIASLKLASNISRSFLRFERYCRIWGEVKRQEISLAQARLGIVAIVQLLLRFLLKEKLGLLPLLEL